MKRGIVAAVERTTNDDGQQIIELQVDPEGSATVTAEYFDATGEDSPPLVGDSVALIEGPAEGTMQAIAWQDPKNPTKSADGEKRIYSRDPQGAPAVDIWLKGNGDVAITVIKAGAVVEIKTAGVMKLSSPDVRVGDGAGQPIARVGDMVVGSVYGLSTAPSSPLAPNPAPVPGTGIPFSGQIVSGAKSAKA